MAFEWSCGVSLFYNSFPSPLCVYVCLFLKKQKKKKKLFQQIYPLTNNYNNLELHERISLYSFCIYYYLFLERRKTRMVGSWWVLVGQHIIYMVRQCSYIHRSEQLIFLQKRKRKGKEKWVATNLYEKLRLQQC